MINLSVIVPVYNTEQYLEKCIDSILRQNIPEMEVILIDDASSDGSGRICDKCAEQHENVVVCHQESNRGLVRARKKGLELSQGHYVTYVDSDDYMEENTLSQMLELMEREKADLIACGFQKDDGTQCTAFDNRVATGVYAGDTLKSLYNCVLCNEPFFTFGIIPALWVKMFRKELLTEVQYDVPDTVTMGEDVAVFFPALLRAKKIVVANGIQGYHYMISNSTMTKTFSDSYFPGIHTLCEYLKGVFRKYHHHSLLKQLEIYRSWLVLMGVYGIYADPAKNASDRKRLLAGAERQYPALFDFRRLLMMPGIEKEQRKEARILMKKRWAILPSHFFMKKRREEIRGVLGPVKRRIKKCFPNGAALLRTYFRRDKSHGNGT